MTLNLLFGKAELVAVKAVTKLHPGSGTSIGQVDSPVQRDALGYPILYSTTLKGPLRTLLYNASQRSGENARPLPRAYEELFGPDILPEGGGQQRGSAPSPRSDASGDGEGARRGAGEPGLAVLDALLLAVPVRSVKGAYLYVTTRYLVEELVGRVRLIAGALSVEDEGLESLIDELNSVWEPGRALLLTAPTRGAGQEALGLEDYMVGGRLVLMGECYEVGEVRRVEPGGVVGEILGKLGLERPLVVLDDARGRGLIDRAMARHTRNRLERGVKTVARGALWTEEYLPEGTVFHTAFLYRHGSRETVFGLAGEAGVLHNEGGSSVIYLVIGGKETVGKGVVKLIRIGEIPDENP